MRARGPWSGSRRVLDYSADSGNKVPGSVRTVRHRMLEYSELPKEIEEMASSESNVEDLMQHIADHLHKADQTNPSLDIRSKARSNANKSFPTSE